MDTQDGITAGHHKAQPGSRYRSLVADSAGIIFAETVNKCIKCYFMSPDIDCVEDHYWTIHGERDFPNVGRDVVTCSCCSQQQQQSSSEVNSQVSASPSSNNSSDDSDDMASAESIAIKQLALMQNTSVTIRSAKKKAPLPPVVSDDVEPMDEDSKKDQESVPFQDENDKICHNQMHDYDSVHDMTVVDGQPKSIKCSVCHGDKRKKKRYGLEICETCYRKFCKYKKMPVALSCPTLGSCGPKASPANDTESGESDQVKLLPGLKDCKACWLKAFLDVYTKSPDASKELIDQHYPKMNGVTSAFDDSLLSSDDQEPTDGHKSSGEVLNKFLKDVNGSKGLATFIPKAGIKNIGSDMKIY